MTDGRSGKRGVAGHTIESLQHLGPDAFHCNGAQLANTARHRQNHFKQPGRERGKIYGGRETKN